MEFSVVYFAFLFAGTSFALVATDTGSAIAAYLSIGAGAAAIAAVALTGKTPPGPLLLATVTLFGAAAYALNKPVNSAPYAFLIVIFALALGLHLTPGLPQFLVFNQTIISDRYPHTLNISGGFDKGLAGLAVLIVAMYWPTRISLRASSGIREWWRVPVVVIAMVAISVAVGALRLDPKWPDHIGRFILSNALLTCAAEEALFRGIVFGCVRSLLPNDWKGSWITILVTSVPFALVHTGDFSYLVLVLGVGIGCGWIRERTGHISAAFAAHALINIAHITLLSYPSI